MNSVALIGRLTKDPEARTTQTGTVVCRFSLAVDRDKEGADFPNVVCFGKTAENVGRFMSKGRLVGVSGRIQTGSYEKQDGTKVYTTDVVAYNVQFLDKAEQQAQQQNNWNQGQNNQQNNGFVQQNNQGFNQPMQNQGFNQAPQNQGQQFGWEEIAEDIPF